MVEYVVFRNLSPDFTVILAEGPKFGPFDSTVLEENQVFGVVFGTTYKVADRGPRGWRPVPISRADLTAKDYPDLRRIWNDVVIEIQYDDDIEEDAEIEEV